MLNKIPLILLIFLLKDCSFGGASSSKLTPSSSIIEGQLGNYLTIDENEDFEIYINEDKFNYEIKVTLTGKQTISDVYRISDKLYIDVFDKDNNPVTKLEKFRGPSKYDDELEAVLKGNKRSMVATFTCNGSNLIDFADVISDFQNNRKINSNKIIRRLKNNLRASKAKFFKVSSY